MGTLIICIIAVILYFLPTIVADMRGRPSGSIFIINIFFGWTFIGWVIALAMAMSSSQNQQIIIQKSYRNNRHLFFDGEFERTVLESSHLRIRVMKCSLRKKSDADSFIYVFSCANESTVTRNRCAG